MASLGNGGDEIPDGQQQGEDHQVPVAVVEEEDHAAAGGSQQRAGSGGGAGAGAGDLHRGRGGEVAAVGGAAGAIAVQSPTYSALTVERHVRNREWGLLQEYLRQFMERAGADHRLHHIPMLHCRRGHLIDLMAARKHSEALDYFMHQLNGNGMRNVPTQFAHPESIKSEIDMVWGSMTRGRGNPIQEPENVADRINDYMRFNFPRAIGYSWRQGRSLLWRFAYRICMRPTGHATFRCLLCQMVFDKGSIQSKLEKHLNGSNCPGMTEYARNVFRETESQIKEESKSALKRPSSSQVVSKDHSESIKMPRFQSATKASKEIAVGDPSPTETGNIGYALLVSLSAVIPQTYADELEICIGNINGSMDEEIRRKEAMNGRSIILDLLLCTDVTKDQCRELSNYFNSICCSVQQPHPQQPNAPPQQEMVQPTAHIEFDNFNIEGLLNCFNYDEEEKIYIDAPPSPYDHIWDCVDQEADGGLDEPDGNPEGQ